MSEGRLIKNKLRIVRQVGRGGMGYVYEAFHEGLRVTRALKQIVGDLQDNPEIERRFLHEAQMMARLEHPHIVRVFDIDNEPGFGTYLLMEFIRGRDLGELLREEGRFSFEETLRIGIAVASALECAHRAGLVHRDVKPANILIEDGTLRPVVTDFGIAKEVESAGDESFTRTGSFVGTYRYSSREQIRSEKGVPIDGRADVYSLGVVLYEIYAGRKYLPGMPELKIASCVGYQDGWTPEVDYPEPPPPLFARLILDTLEPDRDRRVPSATDLVRRLEECRRLESIEIASGGGRGGGESPLAAAGATQSAPSAGGALSEATATVRGQPADRPATANETRSQWVALLQGLRSSVDDQAGDFERLLKELIELDIPRDDFRQLDDMSQILHRVERAESDGQFNEAAAGLQGLSDRIQLLNEQMEETLSSAVARGAKELTHAWHDLAASAAELLPDGATRAFEQIVAPLEGWAANGEWEPCRNALRDARAQLERSRGEAADAARARSGEALRQVEASFAEIGARDPEAAARSGIDPAVLARSVAGEIERGRPAEAVRQAAAAAESARQALARLDEAESGRAGEARASAERARAALAADEARELAPEDLAGAEEAWGAAIAALERGATREAETGFARAADLYARAAERVHGIGAAQLSAAEKALDDLLRGAAEAPEEVVGEARGAAQRVRRGERARERPAALAEIASARAALERSLGEVGPFEEARAAEAAAVATYDRVVALGPRSDELAASLEALESARGELAGRGYAAARDRFARAAASLEDLERDIVARGEEERLAAAREQVEAGLAALDPALAAELCPAELERAKRARDAAQEAARAGERGAALAACGEAIGALRDAERALFAGLDERAARLREDARGFVARAGTLLPSASRARLEGRVKAVDAALAERSARAAAAALDEGRARLGETRSQLGDELRGRATEGMERIRSAISELGGASGAASADPDAVARDLDGLLGEERLADAAELLDGALARVEATLEDERRRRREAAAAARAEAEDIRSRVDLEAAGDLAAAELARSDEVFAAAVHAEAEGDLLEAARGFAQAAAAAGELRMLVRERQLAQVEVERAELAKVVESAADAPEEIVGRTRSDAATLLDATMPGDLYQALATIRRAREELAQLVEEGARFVRARDRQAAARGTEARVAALRPTRRQSKAPAALLRDADAAFAKRAWDGAAERYEKAAAAWATLEGDLRAALPKDEAAAGESAAAVAGEAERAEAARRTEEARKRDAGRAAAEVRAGEAARQREEEGARRARDRGEARAPAAPRVGKSAARGAESAVPVAAGAADATVVGDRAEARGAAAVPEAGPRAGVPVGWIGAGVGVVAAAVALVVWLGQREATTPVETAKVSQTEPAKPPATEAKPPATEKVAPPEAPSAEPAVEPEAPVQPAEVAPGEKPAEEPVEVAKVAPPEKPAPPPLRISGFTPDAGEVKIKEGSKQAFNVRVAGGDPGTQPKIVWRLGDRIVARDVDRWEYEPGYDEASDAPRALAVEVGEGSDAAKKSWRIEVANVNRKPTLDTSPKAGGKIEAKLGEKVKLSADVKDPDGDKIAYAWKIDGKPAGKDAAQLEVPVSGDRSVSLTASDGDQEVTASWQIAAIKPELRLDTRPARLERLRYEKPQEFALSVPRDAKDVEVEWTVDGRKVASGPRFTFENDDPGKVRRTPVRVAAIARDGDGRKFERTWDFVVEPPAPQVTGATPPAGNVDGAPGSTQSFALAARSPIGGQDLSYVFQVDGRQEAKGSSPSFRFRVGDDRPHRIVGYVQDNFGQTSGRTEWSIVPGPDVLRQAKDWLDQYQQAFNAKDARRLVELRGMSANMVGEMQDVLDNQENLRVTFSNVRVEKLDDQRARITYTRTDQFTDPRGDPISRTGDVEQTVGMVNGRMTELDTRRR